MPPKKFFYHHRKLSNQKIYNKHIFKKKAFNEKTRKKPKTNKQLFAISLPACGSYHKNFEKCTLKDKHYHDSPE